MPGIFSSISPYEWGLIIVESITTAVMAIILFRPLGALWDWLLFGRWKTEVTKPDGNKEITILTPEESKNFNKSPLELIKYIKGEASNYYVRLNIKVLSEEASQLGLFRVDKKNRTYYLDLTKCAQAGNKPDIL